MLATEYPTRYVAFDNPRMFVENAHPKDSGGHEWAVFSDPIKNKVFPGLEDGVYAEIVSYQGKDYLFDGVATRPDRKREQSGVTKRYPTYLQAKDAALKWIPKGEAFARGSRRSAGVLD